LRGIPVLGRGAGAPGSGEGTGDDVGCSAMAP
jgi:hypothetical protein